MGIEVAVVVQSGSYAVARQARAIAEGVAHVDGARAQLLDVDEFGEGSYAWTALDKADAIVFAAPTYLGSVPAGFRRLKEAAARRRKWRDKFAGGLTYAATRIERDDAGLRQLASIAEQHGMRWIDPASDPETLGRSIAEAALRSKGAH